MPEKQQGLGKTRFRQFTRELNSIIRNSLSNVGFFSTIDQVEQTIDDLITELNNDNEVDYTPNWFGLWDERMSQAKAVALAKLSQVLSPPQEEEQEDEEQVYIEREPIDNTEEITVIGYIGEIPIVDDNSYRALQRVASRRKLGFINVEDLLEYISRFRSYVIAIQIIGGLYYIWVTSS